MTGCMLLVGFLLFLSTSLVAEPPAQSESLSIEENVNGDSSIYQWSYTYQSVVNLNTRYSIIPSTSYVPPPSIVSVHMGSQITDMPTDMKLPDEEDPSVFVYMDRGPIRYYLPTTDIHSLKSPDWRYRECDFHVVKLLNEANYEFTLPSQRPYRKFWRALIEARCDDPPGVAVQYLIGAAGQLLAFTIGELSESNDSEEVFQPKETYFLTNDLRGFGWVDSAER